jgi:NadR type nicotinamide-nucleotide adenylyltransferase
VFTSEDYGDGFAASLTAWFRDHGRPGEPVRHVCVDRAREAVPISATRLRADPWGQRGFLAPQVYADLIARVAVLGGESSGKTWLAQALARHFDTAWVPEYGRVLWHQREGRLRAQDLPAIAREQVRQEQQLAQQARGWLFCDTTPLTTAFYSQDLFGEVDPGLAALAGRDYDRTVLCAPDFAFVQDGSRRDEPFRQRQHQWYLDQLKSRRQPFALATGPLPARVAAISTWLSGTTSPIAP